MFILILTSVVMSTGSDTDYYLTKEVCHSVITAEFQNSPAHVHIYKMTDARTIVETMPWLMNMISVSSSEKAEFHKHANLKSY